MFDSFSENWVLLGVTSYPMTASGKIRKFKLQELAIRELQMEPAWVPA